MKDFITKNTIVAKLKWETFKTKKKEFQYLLKTPYQY